MTAAGAKAVFLDKDGTLVRDVPYNVDPARVELSPGALECVQRLKEAGYLAVVVSNQAGIAHGFFTEAQFRKIEEHLGSRLPLDGFYHCPHAPEAGCACRKPAPGLLARAAREHGIDLGRSWMVGDILDDVEAGRRAGCRTVLIDNGNETLWELTEGRCPDRIAPDLAAAAALILEDELVRAPTHA